MESLIDDVEITQTPLIKAINNITLLKETIKKIDSSNFIKDQDQLLKRSLSVLLYTFFEVYIRDSLNLILDLYKKITQIQIEDLSTESIMKYYSKGSEKFKKVFRGKTERLDLVNFLKEKNNHIKSMNLLTELEVIEGEKFINIFDFTLLSQSIQELDCTVCEHLNEDGIFLNSTIEIYSKDPFMEESIQTTNIYTILNSFTSKIRQPIVHEYVVINDKYETSTDILIKYADQFISILNYLNPKFDKRTSFLSNKYSID